MVCDPVAGVSETGAQNRGFTPNVCFDAGRETCVREVVLQGGIPRHFAIYSYLKGLSYLL